MATDSMYMHELAQRGAKTRLMEIEAERNRIHELFPDLRGDVLAVSKPEPRHAVEPLAVANDAPPRRARKLSAAKRKAISKRMKAYWANRRESD